MSYGVTRARVASNVTLRVTTPQSNSYVALVAIDKGSELLGAPNDITETEVSLQKLSRPDWWNTDELTFDLSFIPTRYLFCKGQWDQVRKWAYPSLMPSFWQVISGLGMYSMGGAVERPTDAFNQMAVDRRKRSSFFWPRIYTTFHLLQVNNAISTIRNKQQTQVRYKLQTIYYR